MSIHGNLVQSGCPTEAQPPSATLSRVPDIRELNDLARSAFETSLAFGVTTDAFERLAHEVARQCQISATTEVQELRETVQSQELELSQSFEEHQKLKATITRLQQEVQEARNSRNAKGGHASMPGTNMAVDLPDQNAWLELAAAMYQAAGAYNLPVRFLDVLSAAANNEPFAHMLEGLLPIESPTTSGDGYFS